MDFERDQAFSDRKLSFLNHWVFGTGIAMGLGVERIDSDSLLVEPGMAIDPQGRYLIVDEPMVCRVKTLDGFSELEGETTLLRLFIDSFCPEPLEAELHYTPHIPGFVEAASGGMPYLSGRLRVSKGETVLSLFIRAEQAGQAVSFALSEDDFTIEKRGVKQGAREAFHQQFRVVSGSPLAALEELLLPHAPQELWESGQSGVPIAAVRFVRYDGKARVDDVIPLGSRSRAAVPYLRESLRRVGLCYRPQEPGDAQNVPASPPGDPAGSGSAVRETPARQMTTGTVRLNTGMSQKAGSLLISEEIAHGLGPGTVYVEFGVEHIYPAAGLERNRTDLLLGDVSLFEQASGTYEKDMAKGVRVHPDKGTFELAVRLGCDLHRSALRLRWFAWRPEEAPVQPEEPGTLLRLRPDVVRAGPGEVLSFTPVFACGQSAPCDFFTSDRHGGVITRDGVYTAPDREGLYQIYAQVQDKPEERVNAFILVGARDPGDSDERGGV